MMALFKDQARAEAYLILIYDGCGKFLKAKAVDAEKFPQQM